MLHPYNGIQNHQLKTKQNKTLTKDSISNVRERETNSLTRLLFHSYF